MKLSNSSNPPIPNYCRIKKSVYAYVENKAVKTKIKLWTLESLIKSNGKIVKGKSNIKILIMIITKLTNVKWNS